MDKNIIAYIVIAILVIIALNFLLHVDLISLLVGIAIGYFGSKYIKK